MRWYRRNRKAEQRVVQARYYAAHREECIDRATPAAKSHYVRNSDKVKKQAKAWRQANSAKRTMYQRMRRHGLTGAVPAWYEHDKVERVYEQCRLLNEQLNRSGADLFQVDHIIPLVSKTVCGLHCWANLQVLCKAENSAKRNRYQREW